MNPIKLAVFVFLLIPSACYAAGCEEYPFGQGVNVEDVKDGIRIIATASVSVSFDDIDAVKDARDEAVLEAKSLISQFMSEGIRSDQAINRAIEETKSMQGEGKSNARKETVERLKRLVSSSQNLLRGAVQLGECYTKGREFRASVGIKPETISAAETLNNGISNSLNPAVGASAEQGNNSQKPSGVESYSNTEGLKKF